MKHYEYFRVYIIINIKKKHAVPYKKYSFSLNFSQTHCFFPSASQLHLSAIMVCHWYISCFCSSYRCCRTRVWSPWKVRGAPEANDVIWHVVALNHNVKVLVQTWFKSKQHQWFSLFCLNFKLIRLFQHVPGNCRKTMFISYNRGLEKMLSL